MDERRGVDVGELTRWQRMALRRMLKAGGKRPGESLEPADWATYFELTSAGPSRLWKKLMLSLPASPRCGVCGAPFSGIGSRIVRPLGYQPSRKNPNLCATCVELAPPGGMTMEAGVLFADIRGFTTLAERSDPEATSRLLRRFYSCAEQVLFPAALIDKLIGDQVMALYLSYCLPPSERGGQLTARDIGELMLGQAKALLVSVGYGSPEGPFAEIGVGLDFGQAFVGNLGDGRVKDFTAVGDVVNTAARLQAAARGGEIVLSAALAEHLHEPPGERIQLQVKGKATAVDAYRVGVKRKAVARG